MKKHLRHLLMAGLSLALPWGAKAGLYTSAPLGGSLTTLPNGSFESPDIPLSPGFQYNPAGTGWTFGANTAGSGMSRNGTGFTSGNPNAPNGSQVLFLQGNSWVTRSINFTPGTYTFSYYAAQRGNMPGQGQVLRLQIDGITVATYTPTGSTYQLWTSPPVSITTGPHTVRLEGTNPLGGDHTALVDLLQYTRVAQEQISGFESPILPASPGYVYQPVGGPWTFGPSSGLTRNGTAFTSGNPSAPEGQQVLFLQGTSTASTSFTVTRAGTYRIRFKAAIRGNNSLPRAKRIRCLVDGMELTEANLTSPSYTDFASAPRFLSAGTHTVALTGVDPLPGDHTGFVDDLRFEQVYEWADPSTWGGAVPGAADDVIIPAGSAVTMRSNITVRNVVVNGALLSSHDVGFSLSTRYVLVQGGAALLEVGQENSPFIHSGIFTLTGTSLDPGIMGMGTKFIGSMGGTIHMHGAEKISWSQLGQNVNAGSSVITMKEAVNWTAGDEVLLTSSNIDWTKVDKRTIASVNGTSVTLTAPLTNAHKGVVQTYTGNGQTWTADIRAEVGLLTHNIKIQGDAASAASGFGGHVMIMDNGKAYVEGVEFYLMGQKALMGRYPFHWHMLGDQGNGQYLKNSSIHKSFNRAVTIHGTESTLVENNFCYDHIGHGLFLEDGSERFNVIRKNVVLLTTRPAAGQQVTPSDNQLDEVQNRTPASYWITNPQNTFEDNVAAGTQGTGFWFAFPKRPMGLSHTDWRFASLQPHTLPLTAFRRNRAHSCMSGFDIFDHLTDPANNPTELEHKIIPNGGWYESGQHVMEDCQWYLNNHALYTGVGFGGPTDNLIFRRNVFVENLVGTMFASYSVVDQSVFVATSGQNLLVGDRYAWRLYDGAGAIRNSHFQNWNASNANLLANNGASLKHVNTLFQNNTMSPAGTPRIVLPDFSAYPANTEPSPWIISARDVTGTVLGAINTNVVSNHPWMLVGNEFRPTNWINAYRSNYRFVLAPIFYGSQVTDVPDVVCTRSKVGTSTRSVYLVRTLTDRHQLPLIVGEGFEYAYQYVSLPQSKQVVYHMQDATVGDDVLIRFKNFGRLGGLTFSSSHAFNAHTSLTSLKAARASGYYRQANGDVWIRPVATGRDQSYTLTWNVNYPASLIDSDGDQKSDSAEVAEQRMPFEAGDLETGFEVAGDFEGWTGIFNVAGATVANGKLSGTAINNGDAAITNDQFNFSAKLVPRINVRMKATGSGSCDIYFATDTQPGFSGSRVVSVPYTGNGAFEDLAFTMDAHPDWAGEITDLRIDPVSAVGLDFEIEFIRAGCVGTDSDNDGICDSEDKCPALDDHLLGTPCSDGDTATFNDIYSANCDCAAGFAKQDEAAAEASDPGVRVYPMPAGSQLNVDWNVAGMYHTARLIDLQGRVLLSEQVGEDAQGISINLDAYRVSAGVYLLQMIGNGKTAQAKVLKH